VPSSVLNRAGIQVLLVKFPSEGVPGHLSSRKARTRNENEGSCILAEEKKEMRRLVKNVAVLAAIVTVFGASAAVAQPVFDLGLSGLDAEYRLGELTEIDVAATMTPSGDLANGDGELKGAQGWSISIAADGCASITSIALAGSDAAGIFAGGFEQSETTDRAGDGSDCVGLNGAVSAVVLSFTQPITLSTEAGTTESIAALKVVLTPEDEEAPGSLAFVNGCRGAGQPVANNVTWEGETIIPNLSSAETRCVPVVTCINKALNAFFSTDNVLQVEGDSIAGLLTGDIDAPEASATISSGATIYGAIGSNLPTEVDGNPVGGVQGWSISASVSGDITLADVTTMGTAGGAGDGGLQAGGFEQTATVDPSKEPSSGPLAGGGAQGEGAVSAIVLSFTQPITLANVGTASIIALTLEGEGDATGSVAWIDGLQGAGQPVANVATVEGETREFCARQPINITIQGDPRDDFIRGDANDDNKIDIADGIWIINMLFRGGDSSPCMDISDVDNSGNVDVTDATSLIAYQFTGGAPPAAPFDGCGKDGGDEDDDGVICETGSSACD